MALFLGLWVRDVGRGLAPAMQNTHELGQIRTLCCSGGTKAPPYAGRLRNPG